MRSIKNLGENGILSRVFKRFSYNIDNNVIVQNGDDAFVSLWKKRRVLVATTDMLIEDVHFSPDFSNWQDIGYKAMAVNISDLSAMGDVRPLYALISIGLNPSMPVNGVDKLLTGLWIISQKVGIKIVGGDTVKSQKHTVISITLIGEALRKNIVTRSGAQVGDKLLMSGELGLSGAGLKILQQHDSVTGFRQKLVQSHRHPPIRLSLANWLGRNHIASSMIDSSDGLHASLEHLCRSSRIGISVNLKKLPVASSLGRYCRSTNADPYRYMLFGGEDYELIFTVPRHKLKKIKSASPKLYIIGEVVDKKCGIQYMVDGKKRFIKPALFKHF